MFISVFNHACLNGCHPPEMRWCLHEGRLVKLRIFWLPSRKFDQSFLWVFHLLLFTKWPNLWRNKCAIACAKRKRRPLVCGHHWSPASTAANPTSSLVIGLLDKVWFNIAKRVCFECDTVQYTLKGGNVKKCIWMGMTVFGEENCRFCSHKSRLRLRCRVAVDRN